jgi:hypothetical protein
MIDLAQPVWVYAVGALVGFVLHGLVWLYWGKNGTPYLVGGALAVLAFLIGMG